MFFLFLIAETSNPKYTADQIFLGIEHTFHKMLVHEDGYTRMVLSWQGNCMEQIEFRCENLDDVIEYYIC